MRFAVSLSVPLSLCAAALLAGCQSEAPSAPPAAASDLPGGETRQQAYTRELLALKAAVHDQRTLEARHRDLLLKYGYPLPEAEPGETADLPVPGSLAKAAASRERQVKHNEGSNYRTFKMDVDVPNREALSVRVVAQGAADPFLVAYYSKGGDAVRFAIVKDDSMSSPTSGSLSPNGTWTNSTGAKKTVSIVVFAALTSGRGTADIYYRIGSNPWVSYIGARVGGTVQYMNQDLGPAPAGCVDAPIGSRFDFKTNSGSNTVQLLAYSDETGDGIAASASSSATWTQTISDWIPTGEPYSKNPPGTDYKENHHFVMAARASTTYGSATVSGGYTFNQVDLYDCN